MVKIHRIWFNTERMDREDHYKITLFSRPRVSIHVDEYIWSFIEENIVKPHKLNMTYPLILAKIPVKNPWEIFAYLPFGGWNECPNTPELMAVAKYWFEQHGAVPAAMSHDELEFLLPAPVPEEKAMDAAVELYGFCPDVIDQGPEDATVGALADVLRQSTVWYFWWD